MSSADVPVTPPATAPGEHAPAGHDAHGHPPHLAHHFDTPLQQVEAGKLGMWVFLATEILMFGGLFCYYAYSRGNFPAVAEYSHHFLNPTWGAINTVVLLVSSFTMAWGVRAAQLGQRTLLINLLILTLLGACAFMVIKGIEYTEKFSHDLYPGRYNLYADVHKPELADETWAKIHHLEESYGFYGDHGTEAATHSSTTTHDNAHAETEASHNAAEAEAAAEAGGSTEAGTAEAAGASGGLQTAHLFDNPVEHSVILPAAAGPAGLADDLIAGPIALAHGPHAELPVRFEQLSTLEQQRVPSFFSIYYMMTGLHGIHVLIGMGLIGWILLRAIRNDFGPEYFAPVDIVGLYWHLVDLIWIFLFPLLYLID